MIRSQYIEKIEAAFKVHPIVAILGPRQCGKTTLARFIFEQWGSGDFNDYFDLEDELALSRLDEPLLAFQNLKGLIVIDEVQKRPDLFRHLRVLVDKPNCEQQYLILGSASRELIKQSSETLAGRIEYIELTPFYLGETQTPERLWLRGGFPRSYLAQTDAESQDWRKAYVRTFLEQDIPNLGISIAPNNIRRFWMMLSHYHGQVANYNEIGRSLLLNSKTVRGYSDLLVSTFMIRQLQPWYENISKRQVKSHKIYIRDSGILHTLLQMTSEEVLRRSPYLGASWEGFALEQIIQIFQFDPQDCYFWATHADAELDLLVLYQGRKIGFEFKYSYQVKVTKSMRIAMHDLNLDQLIIVNPSDLIFPLGENIQVLGLNAPLEKWATSILDGVS